jgi:hypothetical protein
MASGSSSSGSEVEEADEEDEVRIDNVLFRATTSGAIIARHMIECEDEDILDRIFEFVDTIVPSLHSRLESLIQLNNSRGMEWLRDDLENLYSMTEGSMTVEVLHSFIEDIQQVQQDPDHRRWYLQELRTTDSDSERIRLQRILGARRLSELEIGVIAARRAGVDTLSRSRVDIMTHFGCFTVFQDSI